ncbi:MAG: ATP-dependent Clp protease proteolytic subunit, partial [Clostridia bacterium]|nr:ATP-dependent Clp protease proteolytic subunit [Clostridia bacterium]
PGSLWMIHDPSIVAWGNERDLMDSINLLRACKESILNMYGRRCRWNRSDIAALMTATTWMDAQSALSYGFIDAIADASKSGVLQNAEKSHIVDKAEAEKKVQAWLDRHKPQLSRPVKNAFQKQEVSPAPEASLSVEENPSAEDVPSPGDDHTSAVSLAERRCASNLRFEPSAVGKADLRIQGFATSEQAPMPVVTGGTAPPAEPDEPNAPEESTTPEEPFEAQETPAVPEPPEETGIPIAQLRKRLGLIMPAKRSN